MAMETFAVVKWLVKLDLFRQRHFFQVEDVKMPQAAELRAKRAEHGVIRVAGVAGFVRWHPVILKMRCGKIRRVIDVQALSVRVHNVAGKAKRRALGAFHFIFHAGHKRKKRKKEKHAERKNLSCAAYGNRGTHNDNARESCAE
jgi:hypothetical protein